MQSGKPLLSVLVPAYNAGKYVGSCVAGLLVQTYSNIEILLCDDASTDNTWDVIRGIQDERIRIFRNDRNKGKNATAGFLLEKAKGTYITVHDADDISAPERLERLMDFLLRHPAYAMCGSNFVSFLDNGKVVGRSQLSTECSEIREKIRTQSQFHGPTVVIRKDVIDEVGGFYRYFTVAEDIDLTMRITERFDVCNLPGYYYYYRHNPRSLTNDVNGYHVERAANTRLLYHLAEERRANGGIDSLMAGNLDKVKDLVEQFRKEAERNADDVMRQGVYRLIVMSMFRNAVVLSARLVRQHPTVANIKCFVRSVIEYGRGSFRVMRVRDKLDPTMR